MSNYLQKQATVFRLIKLARLARYAREQRALRKYAAAVRMQKAALSDAGKMGVGAGVGALGGGLLGAGIGYGLGKKDKKLMSTLLGAGIGTGVGSLGGYLLSRPPKDLPKPVVDVIADRKASAEKVMEAWKANGYKDLAPGMELNTDNEVLLNGDVVGYRRRGFFGGSKFVPATKFGPGMRMKGTVAIDNSTGEPIGTRIDGTNLIQLVPSKKPTAANVQNNDGYPIVLPYGTMS